MQRTYPREPRAGRDAVKPGRWVSATSTTAFAVTLLLLVAPATLGAHAVVLTAPYSGAKTTSSESLSVSGCAHAGVPTRGYFHGSTGIGGLRVWSTSQSCSAGYGYGSTSSTSFISTVPVTLAHSKATVVAVVLLRAWVAAHLTPGTCTTGSGNYSSCSESAYASLYGYVYLADMTSGATWYPANYLLGTAQSIYQGYYCYLGNCSSYTSNYTVPFQTSSSTSLTINVTGATTTDSFALVVDFSSYADSYVSAYGATLSGAKASATVNAASSGEHIDLASITIS
ncbi:MAG: hypothetical protein L3K19_03110 [Thermoplasmata archaeon]|nr:hypothetical protein [Thermoplasmata archaeon]